MTAVLVLDIAGEMTLPLSTATDAFLITGRIP